MPGAYDFYDGNTATNSTAGHPPCSSNIWGDENSAVNTPSLDNKDLDGVTPLPDSTRSHTCLS